jgi:hypothetical protein
MIGGDCEIRTHGRLPVGSFQDCWFKPLTQVSFWHYPVEMIAELHEYLPNQSLMVLLPVFKTSALNRSANLQRQKYNRQRQHAQTGCIEK